MARQGINTGSSPDAGDGDALLTGALKINANFNEIYTALGDGTNITNSIGFAVTAGISTYATTAGIATYSTTAGISTYANSSRVVIKDSGSTVGTAGTIDFGDNLTVSAISSGIVTVSASGGTSSQWVTTDVGIHTLSSVGIGTTNATSKLTVQGDVSVSGVSTFQNSVSIAGSISIPDNNLGDNNTLFLGNDGDLRLYHNGTISAIRNSTGELRVGCNVIRLQPTDLSETYLLALKNAGVELYYDNSKKFETLGTGVTVTGTTFTDQLSVSGVSTFSGFDNTNVHLGNTGYYSGLTWSGISGVYGGTEPSILTNSGLGLDISGGLGNLILATSGGDVIIKAGNLNPTAISCIGNAQVELNHNGSKKFETLGTGVTVTGTTFTDQLSVSGVSTFNNQVDFGGATQINSSGEVKLDDLKRIMFGYSGSTPNGLVIRQNSSSNVSEIVNVGGDDIQIQADSGRSVFIGNDNTTNSLTVTGTGVTVTGTTFTNQLSVSGIATVTGSVRVGVDTSAGVILTSPNGTQYQLFVEDDGTLNTVAV